MITTDVPSVTKNSTIRRRRSDPPAVDSQTDAEVLMQEHQKIFSDRGRLADSSHIAAAFCGRIKIVLLSISLMCIVSFFDISLLSRENFSTTPLSYSPQSLSDKNHHEKHHIEDEGKGGSRNTKTATTNITSFPPECNWECYINRYPDLFKSLEMTEEAALNHYAKMGNGKEGRKCTCIEVEKHFLEQAKETGIVENELEQPKTKIHNGLSIPERMPLITIYQGDILEESLGKATLDMFRGHWVEINDDEPYSSYDGTTNFCPAKNVTDWKFATCSNSKGVHRVAKKYVADGLRPFNATQFTDFFIGKGPLVFVGDSLSGQTRIALQCMLEAGGAQPLPKMISVFVRPMVAPLPERMEQIEIRRVKKENFDISWVDFAIEANASYVVLNFGAWYSSGIMYGREDWCNYSNWKALSFEDVLIIYEESFRLVLLPQLIRLKAHGIIPIWRDTAPGGIYDEQIGDIKDNIHSDAWKIHPVYNRVGRKITQQAGGLLLPIFDLSIARSDDHVRMDATYTEDDQLHWCANNSPYSVPHVWIQLLQAVLFDEHSEGVEMHNQSGQKLLGEDESFGDNHTYAGSRFTYPKSGGSYCPCSSGETYYHCIANIRCEWVADKSTCIRNSGAQNDTSHPDD